jgi:GDSL-like Lipase/Acylhydrolase family/N-terminus of Esterase_SGNH_hydro-type
MKITRRAALGATVGLSLCSPELATAQSAPETVWHPGTDFLIQGKCWADTATPYSRFKSEHKASLPGNVWGLGQHSAGVQIAFSTDAPRITVRWSLISDSLAMPHMPATGVSGVDLYVRTEKGALTFVGNGRPSSQNNNTAAFSSPGSGMREYVLYLPLYNGASSVEIGVHGTDKIQASVAPSSLPVVYYGTSIAQGGCASRPGLAYTNILCRKLNRDVVNLGFSGSAMLEPSVGTIVASARGAAFVVDALWNASSLPDAELSKRLENFARTLRAANPSVPILFVGQAMVHPTAEPTHSSQLQQGVVEKLQSEGIKGLHLLEGSKLYSGDGEGTVDGVHPNDHGMMEHANGLFPAIKSLIHAR